MAAKAHLSPRHFHRLFLERTSVTPLTWLHQQRIGRAKELLETTDLTVEEIATRVGLGTPANLRRHFRRATSLSPMRYRRLFPGAKASFLTLLTPASAGRGPECASTDRLSFGVRMAAVHAVFCSGKAGERPSGMDLPPPVQLPRPARTDEVKAKGIPRVSACVVCVCSGIA
jgi:hypothetical protein